MENLIYLIKHNVLVVGIISLLTILSTVMSILFGWRRFYNDYLSKTFSIPAWLIMLIIIMFIFKPSINLQNKELKIIEGKDFGVQQINLDGYRFKRCRFNGSELIFNGEADFHLEECGFNMLPKITFSKYAGRTIAALVSMYKDSTFRPLVDQTFIDIKNGDVPKSAPVSKQP